MCPFFCHLNIYDAKIAPSQVRAKNGAPLLEVENTLRCSLSEEQSASNSKRAFVYWLSEFNDLVPDVFWRNLPTHDSVVQSTKCNISDAAAGGNYCRKRNCQRGAIILSLFAQRVVALGRCNYSLIMLHISFLTCQSCKLLVSTQQQQLNKDSKLEPQWLGSIAYQLICQIAFN